jgi:hypothetical protein
MNLEDKDVELIVRAVAFTRVSYFTEAERDRLAAWCKKRGYTAPAVRSRRSRLREATQPE